MTNVVLVEGVRTPHGALLGSLADVSAVDLGTTVLDGLIDRTTLESDQIDWIGLGNAIQAGIGQVPARQALVKSTLPNTTEVTTINEASGSGVRAITLAANRIESGRSSFAIAGGFESMTNAPWILPDYRKGKRYGDATLSDSMILDALWDNNLGIHMGEIAERLVDRVGDEYDLSRERQDQYALTSHRLAAEATENGFFDDEIIPVETPVGSVRHDDGPRPESTLEDLAQLTPAFRETGTITPANASKLSDGAGAVLLADTEAAADVGLNPVARLLDYGVAYRNPDKFNEAVGDVVEHLLGANSLNADDIGAYWINEAFAVQSVYLMDRIGVPREKMNPRGGAVAFGHPIGASGGMLTASLVNQFQQEEFKYSLVGMSIGGGGAIMTLWEQ